VTVRGLSTSTEPPADQIALTEREAQLPALQKTHRQNATVFSSRHRAQAAALSTCDAVTVQVMIAQPSIIPQQITVDNDESPIYCHGIYRNPRQRSEEQRRANGAYREELRPYDSNAGTAIENDSPRRHEAGWGGQHDVLYQLRHALASSNAAREFLQRKHQQKISMTSWRTNAV